MGTKVNGMDVFLKSCYVQPFTSGWRICFLKKSVYKTFWAKIFVSLACFFLQMQSVYLYFKWGLKNINLLVEDTFLEVFSF